MTHKIGTVEMDDAPLTIRIIFQCVTFSSVLFGKPMKFYRCRSVRHANI
ncbi:MAG: hypothetical protein L3J18_16905 [Candidatus Brocadia sp.]|jgi:hypothetical protein|uniref:Uncharacterized protein n=1 Tax=Candidatus Brocadia fulgida TaxID=380242 RepID=A0A0M2UT83_9BACT|nr:MAG: hypothetical protein BROFUL_02024 [Candidatus Brocadia fulgida]MBV6518849.1 hypothetical protein [Candidatus Brocadia fulgida]UJS20548.1 MAG: hypothetical protein L3J18_16905 [Candidatus Brocadia sp.]